MADIELLSLESGYNVSRINNNFEVIEEAINNGVLNRSGGNNVMEQTIDMDSNTIHNVPTPITRTEVVNKGYVDDVLAGVIQPLVVKTITGTSYTLLDEDNGAILYFTNASPIAFTIPLAVAAEGFNFIAIQGDDGQITFGGTAALKNYDSHTKTAGLNASVGFICVVAGEFIFSGKTV